MASTVWRGYISFGLISIPVRLFRAARPERVNLRRLYRSSSDPGQQTRSATDTPANAESDLEPKPERRVLSRRDRGVPEATRQEALAEVTPILEPVHQVSVRSGTDQALSPQSVVKGYEFEKDRFVALEPEELSSIAPKTSASMDISEFVPLAEIDPVYFETSYYVVPEEAGEKAYALLYRALQTTGLVAVASLSMHSREHVVVVRPAKQGLLAHTMFFQNEVRADEEHHAEVDTLNAKELELAEKLIHSLTTSFDPAKYKDAYRERLEALISRKVQGQPAVVEAPAPKRPEVVDIADALRKSLAGLKKPPHSASEQRTAGSSSVKKRSGAVGRE